MKLIIRLLTAIVFCSCLAGTASAQGRIATIDLRKVFDGYWRTKQADANLKDQAADMDKEHKGFIEDRTKAVEEYQKLLKDASDQALSSEARDKKKAAAEKKLLDVKELEGTIRQYETTAKTTLEEKKRRMRDNILTEIRNVINSKAKSSGYAMVVDSASETINNTPVLLYSNGENDLTDAVLSQLNATAPAELPRTDDTPKDDKKGGKK